MQNRVCEPVGHCCNFFRLNVLGTKDISISTEVTNENRKKRLKEKIKHGSYLIGNLIIVPHSFEMVILIDNKIIVDEVVVHTRITPMTEIRKKIFKDH